MNKNYERKNEKKYHRYEVSCFGNFRKNNKGITFMLKTFKNHLGYVYGNVYELGKTKHLKIHRLVAQTFIKNPYNKPQVNHINGIKADNRVENLEWCTISDNCKHAHNLGLRTNSRNKDGTFAENRKTDI